MKPSDYLPQALPMPNAAANAAYILNLLYELEKRLWSSPALSASAPAPPANDERKSLSLAGRS
jgi:hypothetical protein